MIGYIVVAVIMFVLGLGIGALLNFDWQAYFRYKTNVVELGMKYQKEMRE